MFTRVSDKVIRGPYPEPADLRELKAMGVAHVISLETGVFEWFHAKKGLEESVCNQIGLSWLDLDWSDFIAPSEGKIQYLLDTLRTYESETVGQGATYVHCLHGEDRTGIACAAYRVKVQGWTVNDAVAEMFVMGFHKFPYEWLGWVRELREFLSR